MKKLFEKWNSISLILRIVCGLVIGVILGLVVPQATGIAILGDVFVGALKAIAPLLVFLPADQCLVSCREEPWRHH